MTPTVLKAGPYRFFFYSGDQAEPTHVHVECNENIAKFWLAPVRLQSSGGFRPHEIRIIQRIVEENRLILLESWNDYFSD